MATGNIEIALAAAGDFQLDASGDLVLIQDTYQNPAATVQRLIRLILSNPIIYDGNGNPIGPPDDLFNPTYGAGTRADVGEMQTPTLATGLQARIQKGLTREPSISSIPVPVVNVTSIDSNTVSVYVYCVSVTGEIIVIPSLPITLGS